MKKFITRLFSTLALPPIYIVLLVKNLLTTFILGIGEAFKMAKEEIATIGVVVFGFAERRCPKKKKTKKHDDEQVRQVA